MARLERKRSAGSAASRGAASPRRLLALVAHPDDETYAFGGTLARCARDGVEVTVVCATRGERGCATEPADRCGDLRIAELAASCRVLGAASPLLLDLPDGGLAEIDSASLIDRLRGLLAELRPGVVLTMGRDGAYGHTDHLALTRLLDRAVCHLEEPPRLLHAVFPKGLFVPVWRALYRRPGIIDPGITAESLGVSKERIDLVVDVREVRQQKLAAIACHRSQLPGDDPLAFLKPGLVGALLAEEWFSVAGGPALPAGAADPFAGAESPA